LPSDLRSRFDARFEALELRVMLSATYESIDGTGNNLAHPEWGSPGQPLQRLAAPAYGDGISTPAGATRPGARDTSNLYLHSHLAEDIFNEQGMSAFVYAWGQFIDHDMGLTDNATPSEPMNIPVPEGDEFFDPNYTGTQVIGFNRSQHVAGTGVTTPRQQPNSVTSFIDASMIYGSDAVRAAALRTFQGGLLKSTDGGQQLPYNTFGLPNQTDGFSPANSFFIAGDVRANENAELTSLHVLFLREHNRLATQLAKQNPTWNDEQLYQEARKFVIAEVQKITYNEFLPAILRSGALSAYTGYKPNVNPQVYNEFSTAAFRFGHSILGDDVQFFDDNCDTTLPDLKLKETFFAPSLQLDGGTDGLLKYLAAVSSQENDLKLVGSIRNFLFGPPGAGGFDLGALDIQRGRDHGLADYNSVRAAVGLPRITSFDQITSSVTLRQTLQFTYGSVDNVDLFIGGLAEDRAPGQVLGDTFERLIARQFANTRDGDRYWYQNYLSADEQAQLANVSLSSIMKSDTTITNVQPNAFHFDVKIAGRVFNDLNGNGKQDPNERGIAGRYVYLLDEDNAILDWNQTDAQGNYLLNKIQVGTYTVTTDTPRFWSMTTSAPKPFVATTDIAFSGVNFGQRVNAEPGGGFAPGNAARTPKLTQSAQSAPTAGRIIDQVMGDKAVTGVAGLV